MASGKNLDGTVKELIAAISLEHPKWLGKQVHAELHRRLTAMEYPREDPDWPRLSAVHKEMARQEDQRAKMGTNPDDRPWSLAALSFTGIPPEALPAITRAWGRVLASDASPALTIRQARWMGRLYPLFERDDLALLRAATYLALQEQVVEVAGSYPEKDEDAWWSWLIDYAASLGVEPLDEVVDKVAGKLTAQIRASLKSATEKRGPLSERESQAWAVRVQSPGLLLLILDQQHEARKGSRKPGSHWTDKYLVAQPGKTAAADDVQQAPLSDGEGEARNEG